MRAFPLGAPTVRLSATAATSNVALPSAPAGGSPIENVRVVNHGPYAVWLQPGTGSGVTAAIPTGSSSANNPVLPGEDLVFTLPAGTTYIAGICAAGGTANVDISIGEGW